MKRFVILAAALPLFAGTVHAADLIVDEPAAAAAVYSNSSMYVSLHAGIVALDTVGVTFDGGGTDVIADVSTDLAYRIGGAVGFLANENLSFEGELSYVGAALNEATIGGSTGTVEGDASALTVMANAIVGSDMGGWRPYFGVGIGAANVALDVPAGAFGANEAVDNSWTWAAQAFAGIEVEVSQGVSVGARYRYQFIGDTSFEDGGGSPIDLDGFGSHSLEATLKFSM